MRFVRLDGGGANSEGTSLSFLVASSGELPMVARQEHGGLGSGGLIFYVIGHLT